MGRVIADVGSRRRSALDGRCLGESNLASPFFSNTSATHTSLSRANPALHADAYQVNVFRLTHTRKKLGSPRIQKNSSTP
ncbi:hypothetical protein IRJ41_002333 [Triplophysa rosa]|uniref:Uncharacterized protein n=1 Tax=Triplophysa rosa TaxID=992332 RepID=A0A9W7WQ30_TRIRA|nr:hypothetical protein IRJ41_002333 [Triplophysa rosa]